MPAIIAPLVIARVGPGRAREFFITGERFLPPVAFSIGLVQHVASHELALDGLIDSKISQILTSAPNAIAAAKELIFGVAARTLESSLEFAGDAMARARTGEEGQDGMQAFCERQKPPWIEKNEKTERIDTKYTRTSRGRWRPHRIRAGVRPGPIRRVRRRFRLERNSQAGPGYRLHRATAKVDRRASARRPVDLG